MQGECAALFDQAHDALDEYLIPKGAFIQKSTCAGGKLLRHAHHPFSCLVLGQSGAISLALIFLALTFLALADRHGEIT